MSEKIIEDLKRKEKKYPKSNIFKIGLWFLLGNFTIVITLILLTDGALLPIIPIFIILGFIGPLISLFLSKHQAKKAYHIRIISEKETSCHKELFPKESFYIEIVKILSDNLGLENIPEIGVYISKEVNAFATGYNRNNSLIAVSSSLLETMEDEEIVGVVSHEMAHISNGDMITMCILQGLINTIVFIICFPFLAYHWLNKNSEESSLKSIAITYAIYRVIKKIISFFGELVARLFSRSREFKADRLAGLISDRSYIEKTLIKLKEQSDVKLNDAQMRYASFKINGSPAAFDVLSTHPSIDRRLNALSPENFENEKSDLSNGYTEYSDNFDKDTLLKLYLNVSQERFLIFKKAFDLYDESNSFKWIWNWKAFFLGGIYLALRKAYDYFILYTLIEIVSILILSRFIGLYFSILILLILRGGCLNYLNYLRYKKILSRTKTKDKVNVSLLKQLGGGI